MATDVADLRLHVRIDEGSGPVIVMLHGINANADDMRPLIDQLGSGYRIIAPDVLGFGESPKPLDIGSCRLGPSCMQECRRGERRR